jgi:hypothetical protein
MEVGLIIVPHVVSESLEVIKYFIRLEDALLIEDAL